MSTSHSSILARGYALALISAAFLSTTAPFIRCLTQTYQIPPPVLAAWRNFFVLLVLLPFLAWLRPRLLPVSRRDLLHLTGYGLLMAAFNSLWITSVALNGAAVSTVPVYCSATFTATLLYTFGFAADVFIQRLYVPFNMGKARKISLGVPQPCRRPAIITARRPAS